MIFTEHALIKEFCDRLRFAGIKPEVLGAVMSAFVSEYQAVIGWSPGEKTSALEWIPNMDNLEVYAKLDEILRMHLIELELAAE